LLFKKDVITPVSMFEKNQPIIYALVAILIVTGGFLWYYNIAKGKLEIQIRDPPEGWKDASNIYIKYNQIEVHRNFNDNQTGWLTVTDKDKWIDLSTVLLEPKTLGSNRIAPGNINLIRFDITDAIVTVNGVNYTATVANGRLNLAITKGGVTIALGQTTTILIDVISKVTGSAEQGYKLTPAAKAIPIS
jgi:Domain of unknown function (DUF4382)